MTFATGCQTFLASLLRFVIPHDTLNFLACFSFGAAVLHSVKAANGANDEIADWQRHPHHFAWMRWWDQREDANLRRVLFVEYGCL
jgi:hypothetical protein